jgi:hypothetical protein
MSDATFCPSLRLLVPARSTALMCTNILAAVIVLDEAKAFLAVEPLRARRGQGVRPKLDFRELVYVGDFRKPRGANVRELTFDTF